MPDICSTVLTAQAGPPTSYAVLNIWRLPPGSALPSVVVQDGRVTRVSRGMETTLALLWPSYTWMIIAVSERAPPSSLPYSLLAPARESEPRTRMSMDPLSTSCGRSVPSWALMSTPLMLPFSLK